MVGLQRRSGFDQARLESLGARLRKLERHASPFAADGPRPPARGAHWVKPELVAEVAFTEWTRDGLLRHPAFLGLREDKPAARIVRETSRALRPARAHPIAGGSAAPVEVASVRLTHPDRVLYRDQAITKLGLARYYEAVADWMVPHVSDRPLSLVRCPEGDRGACFRSTRRPASRSR
jgi:bifunctional non-homologous end joining protein LigD